MVGDNGMSEFSVNTDKITSIADLLEQQAKKIENAGSDVDSIRSRLKLQGAAGAQVMAAMKTTGNSVKEEGAAAMRIGRALRQIAESYRNAENSILGRLQSSAGFQGSPGTGSGSGGSGNGTQNGSSKTSSVYSSDPVNLNTGNFILDNRDMEIPGFQPLIFRRFYNSMGAFSGMFGKDWNTGFEIKLAQEPDARMAGADVSVMLEDGRKEYFAVSEGKRFLPVTDTTSELLRREDGFTYQTLEGNQYLFDEQGVFLRFEDAHHTGYDLIYANGALEQVRKDTGEYFTFTYGDNGLLESVEDHTGRTCRYRFEEERLKEVILPDGNTYRYFYSPSGKICRVQNPRGTDAVETEYDERFRAVYQRFADGTTNRFEYLDAERAVIMTERNGSRSIHYHNEKYQNIRNVYPDGEESFEYNERGQKTVITDKRGGVTRLQYDARGNVTNILTAGRTKISATYNQRNLLLTLSVNGKKKISNQYNACGDLICTEDGLGRKTEYYYDGQGRVIKAVMPDGAEASAEYDERGNVSASKTAAGGVLLFEYDALNRVIRRTNALGQRQAFSYDVMGRIVSEMRADGCSRQYEYDEWGNIISVRDYDGSIETKTYNENNRPVTVTDAAGRSTVLEYDSMWNVAKVILPNGGIFQYLYDENNRLETVCDTEGNETHYTYDPMGNMLSRTNADGARTEFAWDEEGRCIQVRTADGAVTEYQYDEGDQIVYVRDAEGTELFRSFDAAGQLTEERDSLGRSRRYAYDAAGRLTSMTDERGLTTSWRYGKGIRKPEEILYPDGTKEKYAYNEIGNRIAFTDIYGVTLYSRYDELNRLAAVLKGQTLLREYSYDLAGRIVSEKDAAGNVTEYEYSDTGCLLSVTDAAGNTTRYFYDEMDDLAGILRNHPETDGFAKISYERDRMGRITKITDALGKTETYQYDCNGHIVEKTDRSGRFAQYTYGRTGLLQSAKWADGREAYYGYSPFGWLNEVRDWTGSTRMEYDGAGNLLKTTYPDGRTLELKYDGYGNIIQMAYPDGRQISYEYDSLRRLERIAQGELEVRYEYNPMGTVCARKLSDGSRTDYEYDAWGMLSKMRYERDGEVLDEFSFGYDAMGRRTRYEIFRSDYPCDNGSYGYDYDPTGRLREVAKDGRTIRRYSYNAAGSRSLMERWDPQAGKFEKTEYTYDVRGALLQTLCSGRKEEYRYDDCGNLTEIVKNGQTHLTYYYDASNRLASVRAQNGGRAAYQYNGLGYRTGMQSVQNGREKKVSYVLDYRKVYDNLTEMRTEEGTKSCIWGDRLEGFAKADGSFGWYHTDPQGSVIRTSSDAGTLYAGNYDEFGNDMTGGIENMEARDFGYHGFLFDPVAGTYFAQARQYRSNTGTFDAMDPIGGDITMPDTLNPYSYCGYDPLNGTDKSGYYFGFDDAVAAIVGGIGSVAGKFVGDVVEGITTGNFELSSLQEYIGAGVGGAVGGVVSLYGTPIAGGAAAGGVETLVTEGLNWLSDPNGYDKTIGEVLGEAAVDAGMGAVSGVASKLFGKGAQKFAQSKLGQKITSGLRNAGKAGNKLADLFTDAAHGKSKKQWDQMKNFLANQRDAIAASPSFRDKVISVLFGNLPMYFGQEVWGAVSDSVNVFKILLKEGLENASEWLKDMLGLGDREIECAAAGGGGR